MSNKLVVLLSGTPASGKDTVTHELNEINQTCTLFKRHRSGPGGKQGDSYLNVSEDEFNSLIQVRDFVQHHERYGRKYGVSRKELERLFDANSIPVIHVGKYENIKALMEVDGVDFISVLLTASRESSKNRLTIRHPDDVAEQSKRLVAYDEERQELAALFLSGEQFNFHLIINTDHFSAIQSAAMINCAIIS